MDINEIDYNSLTPEQKKEFVQQVIKQKREFFRGEKPRAGLSAELTKAFADLACRLSPENLHCDGEASEEQVKVELEAINSEWKRLEKVAGRKVTSIEFPY